MADRASMIEAAKTVVVKIGTAVLTQPDGRLDLNRIHHLAEQFVAIRASGRRLAVVSSGAVGAGMGRLGLTERPTDLAQLQAAAATGQAWLIRMYEDGLREFGLHVGQLLLTANDFRTRGRYLNARNTLRTLFGYGVIPIINENDSVSIDEIRCGDNDHLATMVASMLPDSMLVILTSADGLYDADQNVIPMVDGWSDDLLDFAGGASSRLGTGGMRSKLEAVRIAMSGGVNVVIASGTRKNVLEEVLAAADSGTWFKSRCTALPAWKRWIGHTIKPVGQLQVDDGAAAAVVRQGRSLLAVGVREVTGDFGRGESVSLLHADGSEIARGLTNYSARDIRRIAGQRTDRLPELLGADYEFAEVIHRDNLVLL